VFHQRELGRRPHQRLLSGLELLLNPRDAEPDRPQNIDAWYNTRRIQRELG
jgi:hypothetical protein